jgi:hypothetical protein
MQKKNTRKGKSALDRVHTYIEEAQEIARRADADSLDDEISAIDSDTFRTIIRKLGAAKNNLLRAEFKGESKKHPHSFQQTARDIKSYFDNLLDTASRNEEEVSLRLTEMAGWMINGTPEGGQLAQDIYLAIGRAWLAAREVYGHLNMRDPVEQQIVSMHSALLNELQREVSPEKPARGKQSKNRREVNDLKKRLDSIELLPENEAVLFQLETQIHKAERTLGDEEWPEVIGNE